MAKPTNDGNIVKRTSQYIDNTAFDETTQVPGTAIYGTPDDANIYRAQVNSAGALKVEATISTTGLATDSNQTNGSQKTQIVDAGGEAATVTGGKLDVNATASLAGEPLPIASATDAVGVAIVDGSGNQITSFGGGTQYTEGDTDASITGTAIMVEDTSNTLQPAQGDKTNGLDVDVTRSALPTGAATSAKQLPDNHNVVVTSAPTTAVTGTFWQATQPVSGTVTANAGTNLNTSALLTESDFDTKTGSLTESAPGTDTASSGLNGRLQRIAQRLTSLIALLPGSLGQKARAASLAVTLSTEDVTALTPPAAITGFATATNQTDKSQFTKITDGTDTALVTAAGEQNVIATAQPGVDIGDVTINNASGANAVNIQDGGNTITVDGTVAATQSGTWTEANSAAIKTAVETIDNAIAGSEMQVDVVGALPAGTNAIGRLAANSGIDIGDVDVTSTVLPTGSGTSAVTSVNDTASSTTLKASNAARKQIMITNTSSAVLYVKYGATASTSSFSLLLNRYETLIEDHYNGIVDGIWATDPGDGVAMITEIT